LPCERTPCRSDITPKAQTKVHGLSITIYCSV
jgi:hypothetical protein